MDTTGKFALEIAREHLDFKWNFSAGAPYGSETFVASPPYSDVCLQECAQLGFENRQGPPGKKKSITIG